MTGKISFAWDRRANQFEGTLVAERKSEFILKLPNFGGEYTINGDDIIWKQSELGKNYIDIRSEEHTSELQSRGHLVCRLLLEKKKKKKMNKQAKRHTIKEHN